MLWSRLRSAPPCPAPLRRSAPLCPIPSAPPVGCLGFWFESYVFPWSSPSVDGTRFHCSAEVFQLWVRRFGGGNRPRNAYLVPLRKGPNKRSSAKASLRICRWLFASFGRSIYADTFVPPLRLCFETKNMFCYSRFRKERSNLLGKPSRKPSPHLLNRAKTL